MSVSGFKALNDVVEVGYMQSLMPSWMTLAREADILSTLGSIILYNCSPWFSTNLVSSCTFFWGGWLENFVKTGKAYMCDLRELNQIMNPVRNMHVRRNTKTQQPTSIAQRAHRCRPWSGLACHQLEVDCALQPRQNHRPRLYLGTVELSWVELII